MTSKVQNHSTDTRNAENDQPSVSIVMPVYNAYSTLRRTIESVIGQSYSAFELICVDDGSSDESCNLLAEYADHDARIKVIKTPNFGAGHARNVGMEEARGEYLLFFDADDIMAPQMIELMEDALDRSGADFCVCEVDKLDVQTGKVSPHFRFDKTTPSGLVNRSSIEHGLYQHFSFAPWNKLYRTSFVRSSGITFQEITNFNDVFFTGTLLALADSIYALREILMLYTYKSGTSLQDNRAKHPLCASEAAKALHEEVIRRSSLSEDGLRSMRQHCFLLWERSLASLNAGGQLDVDTADMMLSRLQNLGLKHGYKLPLSSGHLKTDAILSICLWCYQRISAEQLVWAYKQRYRRSQLLINRRMALIVNLLRGVFRH